MSGVGKNCFVCGNGGAAADAAHFVTELVASNDYGFDEIFARPVAGFGAPGYVLICLATSGKSEKCEGRWKNRKRAN